MSPHLIVFLPQSRKDAKFAKKMQSFASWRLGGIIYKWVFEGAPRIDNKT